MSIAISGSTITFADLTTQTTAAVGTSFKNRFYNGDMRIDQRSSGSAYAVGTGAVYGSCDRWASVASASGVWTQQRVATGTTDFPFAMRIQRTAGSTSTAGVYIGQVIETTNCQDLAGRTVTLSFYATAGANFSATSSSIRAELWTGTGSDQGWGSLIAATWTGQSAPIDAGPTFTTTRTRYSYAVAIPAGVNEIAVRFATSGTGTAGANDWFQITGVQLEQGSAATEFERRPIGVELALCQRYFCRTNQGIGLAINPSNAYNGTIKLPVTMRTNCSIESGSIFSVGSGSAGTVASQNGAYGPNSQDSITLYNSSANWTTNTSVATDIRLGAEL